MVATPGLYTHQKQNLAEKLKLTANNQNILYFKRSEEERLLFPLRVKVAFFIIIINETAFLYHYLFSNSYALTNIFNS